ncbi:alpha/beta fold hydrolase [Novosphingobium sp. SL115]|uniref:alpha/beta fold hydrolase n=1 Tax=Novosphingobium sp. SL115 TaxID=2995150 RepID=UPI00227291CE|nr:alpha/beta fold hydrolase [Novosphingobium sp. SL115]MCY1671249.1 alpha/beta fold hydrolase [Novosphingobium sp. SL115]
MTTIRIPVQGGLHIIADELGMRGAPTVILGHGGGQTRHSWDRAGHELAAAGYHVINYDLLGHGESEWEPEGDYSYRRRAADLAAIRDLAGDSFAFVGASLGGLSAMAAACHGTVPVALVLVDVVARLAEEGVDRIVGFMTANPDGFASLEDAADAISAYYPDRPRPTRLDGLRKNLRRGDDGRFRWHWDPKFLTTGREHGSIPDMLDAAAWTAHIPTLLVRGMKSDIVTNEGVADLSTRIARLEVADISGAGHMVAGDRNDQFNAAVIGFLGRVMPPGA